MNAEFDWDLECKQDPELARLRNKCSEAGAAVSALVTQLEIAERAYSDANRLVFSYLSDRTVKRARRKAE